MDNFKPYESKPITRMAVQIKPNDLLEKDVGKESTYIWQVAGGLTSSSIEFKAYEEPKVGDWIVRLTEEDTYHVTDKVFRERNIVKD